MPPATAQGRHGFHNPGTRAKAQQFPFTSVRFRDAYPPLPCWPSRASMPAAYSLVRTPAQAGFALRPPVLVAGVLFHHWTRPARLHLPLLRPAPLTRASDALHYSSTRRLTLLLVRPFAPSWQLLWPLLTSRSVLPRRPFRRKARSPRVRTHSFTAQPPDLRRIALATRASRLLARSPCLTVPRIRFLFIGSRFTLHASSQQLLALPQLRFTSFAVASLREDLHLQECAPAGRTKKGAECSAVASG